jgi:hypothetical protein
MAEISEVQQIVENAVARVLAGQLPKLQTEIVQRVLEALPASPPVPSAPGGAGELLQAVAAIHAGTTQKEILKALLESGGTHGARIALFVVKAGSATCWQARGFGDDDALKDFALDMDAGPVSHALQRRAATPGNIAEMGDRFRDRFAAPANEQILILPLVLKDKVAALLYADGGTTNALDGSSLELLVLTTSAWLEVIASRKQARKEEAEAVSTAPMPARVQTVSSFQDPFAAHAPRHVASVSEPAAEVVEVAATAHAAAAAAPAVATDPLAAMSAGDADVHRKAQRFARLLVDEIKLYNQAKVAEGRRNKDLFDRLKEDIEKSRSTYQKRYGNTVAASGDYFHQELVRSLGEEDVTVMGPNFKR